MIFAFVFMFVRGKWAELRCAGLGWTELGWAGIMGLHKGSRR